MPEKFDYFKKREDLKKALPTVIKQRLTRYMTENKLTNKALADKIGVPASLITQYRQGTIKDMRIRNAILLADVFGVTLDQFLGLDDDAIEKMTLPQKVVWEKYLKLNAQGKAEVEALIDSLRKRS